MLLGKVLYIFLIGFISNVSVSNSEIRPGRFSGFIGGRAPNSETNKFFLSGKTTISSGLVKPQYTVNFESDLQSVIAMTSISERWVEKRIRSNIKIMQISDNAR